MRIKLVFLTFLTLIVLSCRKENNSGKGTLTLYIKRTTNDGAKKIAVIDGRDTVNVIQTSEMPNCGNSTFNPIELDAGSHHLLLISDGIAQGEIRGVGVEANQCKLYALVF